MRNATVEKAFYEYTKTHEGYTPFMYCDTLNLVTTGIGNLIDGSARNTFDVSSSAMSKALQLPWKHKGAGWNKDNPTVGAALSQAEIVQAWTTTKLKASPDFAFNKKGGFAYQSLTDATLSDSDIQTLVLSTMKSFENSLIKNYPNYPDAPADAQCAIMTMAWAMGPAFNFPSFKTAFIAKDFAQAGVLSFFKGGGGTIDNRTGINANNVIMFNNADIVQKAGAGFDQLWFPAKANPPAASILPANLISKVPITAAGAEKAGLVVAGAGILGALGFFGFKKWKDRK